MARYHVTTGQTAAVATSEDGWTVFSPVSRTISDSLAIGFGELDGISVASKFGKNPDVTSAGVPEDLWGGGGVYTGFPVGAPEELQVFSSSASDTGSLSFSYLASPASTAYQTATVALTGTTPVNTGITAWRVHTANYDTGDDTTFNVGDITIRHRVTTANVFQVIPIGSSQSASAGYTVPLGLTGYIQRLFCLVRSNSGSIDGSLWIRASGASPRLRRPFAVINAAPYQEIPYGGIELPALTDVQMRVTVATAGNLEVVGGYDIVVKTN